MVSKHFALSTLMLYGECSSGVATKEKEKEKEESIILPDNLINTILPIAISLRAKTHSKNITLTELNTTTVKFSIEKECRECISVVLITYLLDSKEMILRYFRLEKFEGKAFEYGASDLTPNQKYNVYALETDDNGVVIRYDFKDFTTKSVNDS